jgi:hypothetical protein
VSIRCIKLKTLGSIKSEPYFTCRAISSFERKEGREKERKKKENFDLVSIGFIKLNEALGSTKSEPYFTCRAIFSFERKEIRKKGRKKKKRKMLI